MLDVLNRYVVRSMVATEESATLANKLIAEICDRQGIEPRQLGLHADRGSATTSTNLPELASPDLLLEDM